MPQTRGRRIAATAIAAALATNAGLAAAHDRSARAAFPSGKTVPAQSEREALPVERDAAQDDRDAAQADRNAPRATRTPFLTDSASLRAGQAPFQTGHATYYADAMQGRPTSSGERYDRDALTAAHPTLPLGTLVRVTNLTNERSVTVRINDRGPFGGRHLIDLSRAAAAALGYVRQGIAKVRIVPLLHGRAGTDRAGADTGSTPGGSVLGGSTPGARSPQASP